MGAGDPALLPIRTKRAAEDAVRGSGVPHAILRATHLMDSLDLFVRDRAVVLPGPQPHAYHYLAAADFARQAARALEDDAPVGDFELHGPEPLTMADACRTYVRLARPDLAFAEQPLGALRPVANATGDSQLKLVMMLFDASRRMPQAGPADTRLGMAETRLEDWCRARHGDGGVGRATYK